jgi:hypothetical protein
VVGGKARCAHRLGASRYAATVCVGFDRADKVSKEYESPGRFTDGTVLGVAVDLSGEIYLDLECEAIGASRTTRRRWRRLARIRNIQRARHSEPH